MQTGWEVGWVGWGESQKSSGRSGAELVLNGQVTRGKLPRGRWERRTSKASLECGDTSKTSSHACF